MRFAKVSSSFPSLESQIICEDDPEHMFLDLDGSPEEEADIEADVEYDRLLESHYDADRVDPFFATPFTR
jgi:hypothetical protein